MLVVGYEFGDQRILDTVRKRLTKKAGIKVHGCFMVGGPGETRETAEKTIKLPMELKPDTLQFSALTAYPGTAFYKWCKEFGGVLEE
jgi:anaerobic magnesium-protoporphyrin IX monomethyl ester cyclase